MLALESPFYGKRKPEGQKGSKLRVVSDLLTLGVEEEEVWRGGRGGGGVGRQTPLEILLPSIP